MASSYHNFEACGPVIKPCNVLSILEVLYDKKSLLKCLHLRMVDLNTKGGETSDKYKEHLYPIQVLIFYANKKNIELKKPDVIKKYLGTDTNTFIENVKTYYPDNDKITKIKADISAHKNEGNCKEMIDFYKEIKKDKLALQGIETKIGINIDILKETLKIKGTVYYNFGITDALDLDQQTQGLKFKKDTYSENITKKITNINTFIQKCENSNKFQQLKVSLDKGDKLIYVMCQVCILELKRFVAQGEKLKQNTSIQNNIKLFNISNQDTNKGKLNLKKQVLEILEPADDNKIKNVKRINEHIINELEGWRFDKYVYKNNKLNFLFKNNDKTYYIPFSEQEIEEKLKEGDEEITEIVKRIVVGKSGKRNHEEVEQEDEQYSTPKGKREKLRKID